MNKSILVAALLAVALTACGKKEEPKAAAPAPAPAAAAPAPAAAPAAAAEEEAPAAPVVVTPAAPLRDREVDLDAVGRRGHARRVEVRGNRGAHALDEGDARRRIAGRPGRERSARRLHRSIHLTGIGLCVVAQHIGATAPLFC